jgi:hypothetical protein
MKLDQMAQEAAATQDAVTHYFSFPLPFAAGVLTPYLDQHPAGCKAEEYWQTERGVRTAAGKHHYGFYHCHYRLGEFFELISICII